MGRVDVRVLIGVAVGAIAAAGALLLLDEDPSKSPLQAPAKRTDEFFSVNAPLLRTYEPSEMEGSREALAAGIRAQGIGRARIVIDQAAEQPGGGGSEPDWSIPDSMVGALARHGVRADALLVGTAPGTADPEAFAQCGHLAYPADAGDWAAFAGLAVERYGPGGGFWEQNPEIPPLPVKRWEIGNEQNLPMFWCPEVSPEQYAGVYAAARKAALASDPAAEVIVGALAPAFPRPYGYAPGDMGVPEFLRRMVAADPALAAEIPAVGIHPYAPSAADALDSIRRFRGAMRGAGLGDVPMVANEVGWYTEGPEGYRKASESERAKRIAELAAVIEETDCGVEGLGIHAWFTAEEDSADPEDWYGIADPETSEPRETAIAYGAAIAGKSPEGIEGLAVRARSLCGGG